MLRVSVVLLMSAAAWGFVPQAGMLRGKGARGVSALGQRARVGSKPSALKLSSVAAMPQTDRGAGLQVTSSEAEGSDGSEGAAGMGRAGAPWAEGWRALRAQGCRILQACNVTTALQPPSPKPKAWALKSEL